jgi:hypothetical protein
MSGNVCLPNIFRNNTEYNGLSPQHWRRIGTAYSVPQYYYFLFKLALLRLRRPESNIRSFDVEGRLGYLMQNRFIYPEEASQGLKCAVHADSLLAYFCGPGDLKPYHLQSSLDYETNHAGPALHCRAGYCCCTITLFTLLFLDSE